MTKQALLMVALLSAGCSSTQEHPPTYGTGTDELKRSPCAECDMEPFYFDGKFIIQESANRVLIPDMRPGHASELCHLKRHA